MSWRLWTRQRLTSLDLQAYLQDQVVQQYASRAQRLAVGPSGSALKDGMHSWLQDEKALEVVVGGAWVPAAGATVAYAAAAGTGGAAVFTNSADANENRVTTTALNFSATLLAGRVYRAELMGTLNPNAAGQHQVNLRAKSGAAPVLSTSTMVAPYRQYIGAAAGTGRTEILAAGRFVVPTSGSYQFALFIVGASAALLFDGRGLFDVAIDDRGPSASFVSAGIPSVA